MGRLRFPLGTVGGQSSPPGSASCLATLWSSPSPVLEIPGPVSMQTWLKIGRAPFGRVLEGGSCHPRPPLRHGHSPPRRWRTPPLPSRPRGCPPLLPPKCTAMCPTFREGPGLDIWDQILRPTQSALNCITRSQGQGLKLIGKSLKCESMGL